MNKDHLLDNIKRIHFIGIGGSGMCPLAEILHSEGFVLSGSDANESETLDRIRSYGIPVHMGHRAENIEGAELIVYTAAVKQDNPELVAAAEKGIPAIERSVMLGIVTRRYKRSIAVAGTHGKTSTTAMLSQTLIGSGFDPSAIIGGKLPFLGGNSYVGQSDIIVCEACEYVDTFLELTPYISIITNIDADHLDYFKTLDNIKKSFNKFCHLTTGLIIYNGDDENILDAVEDVTLPMITFGFRKTNDYYAVNLRDIKGAYKKFDLMHKGEKLCEIDLMVPGRHNIYNALACAACAHYLGATHRSGRLCASPHRADRHPERRDGNGLSKGLGGVPAPHLLPYRAAARRLRESFEYSRRRDHLRDFAGARNQHLQHLQHRPRREGRGQRVHRQL